MYITTRTRWLSFYYPTCWAWSCMRIFGYYVAPYISWATCCSRSFTCTVRTISKTWICSLVFYNLKGYPKRILRLVCVWFCRVVDAGVRVTKSRAANPYLSIRTARRILNTVIDEGLLASKSPKSPVSLRFPASSLDDLFPKLYPESWYMLRSDIENKIISR